MSPMDKFDKKNLTTARGYTYTYYVSKYTGKTDTSLPTLLFAHGWPDSADLYSGVTDYLIACGIRNPMLVPDMLGYGGTSKPTSPAAYRYDELTQDILNILDAESIRSVISIGHDWGSRFAMRLYNFHPDRVQGLITLNVAYGPPSREPFDLAKLNEATTKAFGYPIFAYWSLFAAPEGPQILKDNASRLYTAMHAAGPTAMREYFCTPEAMKSYLLANPEQVPDAQVRPYARDPGARAAFVERMHRDGFEGAQQWYVATKDNHQFEAEKDLPAVRDLVGVPVLYVGGTADAVCRPEAMAQAKQAGMLPDLEEHMLDAGHWVPYERPGALGGLIFDWLHKKGLTSGN